MKKKPLSPLVAVLFEGTPVGRAFLENGYSQISHADGKAVAGYFTRSEAEGIVTAVEARNSLLQIAQNVEGKLAADHAGSSLALQYQIARASEAVAAAFGVELGGVPRLQVNEESYMVRGRQKAGATLLDADGFMVGPLISLEDGYLLASATRERDDLFAALSEVADILERDWDHDFSKLEQIAADALHLVRLVQDVDFDPSVLSPSSSTDNEFPVAMSP